MEEFGGIDIVVNNASAINLSKTPDIEMKRFDLMHQINARGTFLVTKLALPYLEKSANPHVLMLSPPLDMKAKWFAPHLAYTMAKFGMSLCVLGFAEEFRGARHCGQRALAAHERSRRRRSRTCSAAKRSCAPRARRKSSPTPPI